MALTEQTFNLHKATRTKLLYYLENLSPKQLAKIPTGFNNNVLWNIAHCIATQQILCYKLSGITPLVSNEFIETYRKGTAPDGHIPSEEEINSLKKLLFSTQEQLQLDYQQGIFANYNTYMTSYGFELTGIEDAINFNNTHESMHLGTVIALNYFLDL
ncbi:MAG: DinB family protein [Capnocytophaga sp.]|nr:DinB family protein [Capnocytophaga sp.]